MELRGSDNEQAVQWLRFSVTIYQMDLLGEIVDWLE